jgi:bifunctional non-homologous end joining protein LigD
VTPSLALPRGLSPMLATSGPLPTDPDGWAHEVKWDGVRVLVAVEGDAVRLTSRNGNDVSGAYPELAGLRLPEPALLDGEVVALDEQGRPDFGLLQTRMHVRRGAASLVAQAPVSLLLFDALHVGSRSLLDAPYDERRAVLEALRPEGTGDRVSVPPSFPGDGAPVAEATRVQGMEGVVSKRRDSRYLPGRRSDCWVKVKHLLRQSVVVCGWKPGTGRRGGGLGSLLLGVHGPEGLVYAGHVGTGFTEAALAHLQALLEPLARDTPPYDSEVPREHARPARWVEPVLVGEVELTAWTRDGRLRHPSWKGLRDDVDPGSVVRE